MPTYRIEGIDVHFPYDAYDCQITYMTRVIQALQKGCNALLESPTGTGKTLCLLCATLAWRESLIGGRQTSFDTQTQMNLSPDTAHLSLPTIIYASRTHSQLQQVIRELKSCHYRPKMTILGSREQMCIHKDVRNMRGKAQNNACRSLCKSRSCYHHVRVNDYLKGHPELGCEPIDIEDLLSIGRQQGPCPYYVSRELHSSADILFAPYNYLIDKGNRQSLTGINWESTVLIFDEAHNLESICADAASIDISCSQLTACIAEAKQCIDLARLRIANESVLDSSIDPEHFAILKALLLKLEKKINEIPINSEELGFTRPGPYIFEFLEDLKITNETINLLIDTIDHAINLLEDDTNSKSVTSQTKAKGATCRLQVLRDALKVIFRGGDRSYASSYRVHIHEPFGKTGDNGSSKGRGSRNLSWWCFNPGIAMEEFSRAGVRSIILTSGTLSPLDSFAIELNLKFDVRLENPHVIGSDQIWVGVISSGPSGRPLNSCYRSRDSVEYKQELGNSIVNFSRIVPDGLLVFFPSYYLLNQCIEFWQASSQGSTSNSATIWERICKHKQPVVEPKQSDLFSYANEDFLAKLNDSTSSGAVFFAVCRGKVSEGLDFADRAGRAVVLTGIPYAMKTDPKVRLKREYLDEQCRLKAGNSNVKALTGEEWYVQQAARAVNQAIGRVIRHRDDYGAILLCDERFLHINAQNQLSLWLRPHVKYYKKFGDAAFTLTRFFRNKVPSTLPKKQLVNSTNMSSSMHENLDDSVVLRSDIGKGNNGSDMISVQSAEQGDRVQSLKGCLQSKSEIENDGNYQKSTPLVTGDGSKDDEHKDCVPKSDPGIFACRTTTPLFRGSLSATSSSRCQQTLSSILASVRGDNLSSHLSIDMIAPANRATCGTSWRNVKTDIKRNITDVTKSIKVDTEISADVKIESYQTIDLSSSPVSTGKRNDSGSIDVEVSSKRLKQVDVANGDNKQKMNQQDNEKSKIAANYLSQVRANLNDAEYKVFTDCMKGLKQKSITMNKVLDSVAKLFSAPERFFLFERFGQYVPSQYSQLYQKYLRGRHE